MFSEATINQSGGGEEEEAPGCVQAILFSIYRRCCRVNPCTRVNHGLSCKSVHIRGIKQSGEDIVFQIHIFPSRLRIMKMKERVAAGFGVQFGLFQVSHFILINFPQNVF